MVVEQVLRYIYYILVMGRFKDINKGYIRIYLLYLLQYIVMIQCFASILISTLSSIFIECQYFMFDP